MERQPFDRIEKGHVIVLNGNIRTVRDVSKSSSGFVRAVTFVKLRRSRYGRPTTTWVRSDLKGATFGGILGRRKSLRSTKLEDRLQNQIEGPCRRNFDVHQDDVVGVLW